jgi:hypothetical protein
VLTPCRIERRRFIQSITITIFLLSTFFLNQPLAKADFTPPSTSDWLGSGETSGIFSSGQIIFNITSGLQYYPTYPQIKFRSNNSEAINLGICVVDFRLLRVNENNTLTETDYASVTINSVGKTGWFWASTIPDYPSTYLFGVVVWNASDGSVVGRLIKTIQASDERVVSLTSDKTEFGSLEPIRFTIVNHGPEVSIFGEASVYREHNGSWEFVGPDYGEGVFVDYGFIPLSHDESNKFEIGRQYTDFTQSGVYRLIIGGPFLYLSTDFGVVGVAGSGSTPPSSAVDRGAWMLGGALTGAIVGLIVYYYSRKRV